MIQHALINGRYEILRELGVGGSGCVYAACDRTTDKHVAVKLFGYHVPWDRAAREKFEIEAKVSGRVESEHIVQISDAGVDPLTQLPFLVMELLEGRNFQDLVEQGGRLGRELTVEYLSQVASGLNKAHLRKDREGRLSPIVHRDLKPSNLFLAHHEDGAPLVKILDWGIAKVLTNSITMSGDLRGTPLYMAPEQISPAPVTPATDIWALGLVAFFLLTGRCYWKSAELESPNMPAILKEVCEGPIVPPRCRMQELGVSIDCPPAFDSWFMQCVNLDPTQRFQQAADAIRALGKALGCAPRESQPPNGSLLPYSRDIGIALVADGASTIGAVGIQRIFENPGGEASGLAPATRGRPRLLWIALSSAAAVLALLAVLLRAQRSAHPAAVPPQVVSSQPPRTSLVASTGLQQSAAPTAPVSSPLPAPSKGRPSAVARVRVSPTSSTVEPTGNAAPVEPAEDLQRSERLEFDRLTGPSPNARPSAVQTSRDPFASAP